MKISIDGRASTLYRGTGIGNYTYQLLNNLNKVDFKNNYQIHIPSNSLLDIDLMPNFHLCNSLVIEKNNFWHDIQKTNLIDTSVDIYHTPQNGIGILKDFNNAQTITLHDIIPLKMPETVSNNYLNIFNSKIENILKTTDSIITVSNFSKDDIHKTLGFPKEKIFVTHLGAENQYKPLNKCDCFEFIKKYYGISENYILYVGGFSPRKNILGLIEAFSLIKDKLQQNTKLVIIGHKGISYEIYKTKAINLNVESDVIFTGFIESNHMPYFYNAANMLVYPSFYEGFGLPPLEAMACKIPVITSNVTSIPEVVEDAAYLINPFDSVDISNAILNISNNSILRNTLIEKGFKQSKKHSWELTALETLKAYTQTVKFKL